MSSNEFHIQAENELLTTGSAHQFLMRLVGCLFSLE
jgi:hypothetical protein